MKKKPKKERKILVLNNNIRGGSRDTVKLPILIFVNININVNDSVNILLAKKIRCYSICDILRVLTTS